MSRIVVCISGFSIFKCLLFLSDPRCPGSTRTCDQHLQGTPEFTWSIVAAENMREERNEKSEKKARSPQGWEEGKNEGIALPPLQGNYIFQKNVLNIFILSNSVVTLNLMEKPSSAVLPGILVCFVEASFLVAVALWVTALSAMSKNLTETYFC